MSPLDQLKTILVPPSAFRYRPNADADHKLREAIGQALPSSYKEFLRCYGPGYIRTTACVLNFLSVYDPGKILQYNQSFYNALGEPLPRPHCPQTHWTQPGGWLMWGYSCDGHQYYWRREGEPDDWPIVVEDRHSNAREEFDLTLPEFLCAILTGSIRPRGVPSVINPPKEAFVWDHFKD